ncbi:MAG: phosphoribosyltransferase family protein [bacterium]|nr:phosphoribosyltransferase family protein [bacterium]
MLKPLVRLKTFVLDLFFPLECLGCGLEGVWLCSDCLRRLKFSGGEKIYNLKAPALNKIFIAGDYDDALLADMIKKFKYHFLAAIGKPLADFLVLYWSGQLVLSRLNNPAAMADNSIIIPDDSIIIPVPLSKKRERWRGFNQAEILAREFAANFSYPLSGGLKRIKHRRAQASLNEAERLENVKGAFAYSGGDLTGRTVILIDDVVTTGATLNEAALALRARGAAKIYGLVLAKG